MTTRPALRTAAALLTGLAVAAAARRRASRIDLEGRSALITGGSRGLGLAIARELGRLGAHVTVAARDGAELEAAREDLAARGIGVSVIISDLSDPTQAGGLVDRVVADRGRLDILVNNAGVIQVGPIEHMQTADFEQALAVHFWAPLQTILSAIPVMRGQGGGRIVNISSIGGKIGVAHLVPYCASKFALTGLSTALRAELAKDKILVTTVSPGLMRTGSPFNAQFKGRHREEFTWFIVADSMPLLTIDAVSAARKIVDACRCGDAELVIGWPAKLAVVVSAIAPSAVALAMRLTNALLPPPSRLAGNEVHSGWQSFSAWAPSKLTRLTEEAAIDHNQLS